MDRLFFMLGAACAGLAVAAGAFGAHALRATLAPASLAIYETAARYAMYHALGLLAVGWAVARWPRRTTALAGWCFVAGTVLFSGSLYALALTGVRLLGALAPVGGVLLVTGWALLAHAAWRGTGS